MSILNSNPPKTESLIRIDGFAGWFTHDHGNSLPYAKGPDLAASLKTNISTHCAQGENYACAGTAVPHIESDPSLVGLVIGNPLWISDELSELSSSKGHCAALTAAYCEFGVQLTGQMRGAFAFVLLDIDRQTTLLGVDRMGRHPLYYSKSQDALIFGTSASCLLAQHADAGTISSQGIYNYVYFHMVPAPHPVYQGMKKLQAGCLLKSDAEGLTVSHHWQPNFLEQSSIDRPQAYTLLRNRLKDAVKSSLPPAGNKVGAFLSGGLDSSTVTGMLAELSDGACNAYSIGFSAEGYDEMAYARVTAKHFGATLHEYYVTPEDVVEALPLIASSYDEPFGNSSALPAYFCAKLAAEDGVSVLLAGDGGDEIFAGNERYAKQDIFESYLKIPSILTRSLVEPLVKVVPDWVPLAEKARSFIAQANTPLPDRLHAYNFLHRHAAEEVFQANYLESIDTQYPKSLQRDVYQAPQNASTLNRMLYLDWQFTLADNDLRKVSQMCSLAGVDVAYPMLEDGLVEFSAGIPSHWKLPGRSLRDFYKKALTGWLPDTTLSKSKQGFGLPFGVWMRTHVPLQEIAYDNILKLKSRRIFNDRFLDNAIAMHKEGHSAYFGELIWILCVLELWMGSHLGENGNL